MAATAMDNLVADIRRYLTYIQQDVRGHQLASVRGAALFGRLQRLIEASLQRIRQRQMQPGLLVPIQALLHDVSAFTRILKSSNIIRLFVSTNKVSQQLREFQVRVSNLSRRLQINVRPFLSADDIRTTSQDKVFFLQALARYRRSTETLASLIRTIRSEELKQLHVILSDGLYTRVSSLMGPGEIDFAHKARRAIEQHFAPPPPYTSRASPLGLGLSPSSSALGSVSPPGQVPATFPSNRPHFPNNTSARSPALQPLASPMLAGLRHAQDHGTGLAQSVPLRPLASPPLSVAGSQVSSLDLGTGFSPDPILFEDVHTTTTTTYGSTSPPDTSANLPTPPSTLGSLHPPSDMHQATPLFPLSPSFPSSTPLPASPRAPVFPPPRPIAIRYYDANTGKFLEWLPFHGWLWQTPHALDFAMDYHGHTVQAQSIVTVLAQFVGLDNTLRQAILDTISPPSRAPSLLRQVVPGDKLKVLRLFSIRDTTWLACVPLVGGKPGFMPLKATALQNRPAPELPSPLPAPLHGSARSFEAMYRFVTSSGQSRLVRCRGVVQPFGIDYHAIPPPPEPGLPQPAVTWLRFPYARLLSIIHMPGAPEVKLTLLDRDRPRAVYLIFGTTSEAIHFLEDVEHMRLVTRKIIELHERRRREAEARQSGENSMGGPGGQPRGAGTTASALGRSVVNDETPTSPGLRSLAGLGLSPFLNTGVHDGSQSPQLSQLGSPRSGALF